MTKEVEKKVSENIVDVMNNYVGVCIYPEKDINIEKLHGLFVDLGFQPGFYDTKIKGELKISFKKDDEQYLIGSTIGEQVWFHKYQQNEKV